MRFLFLTGALLWLTTAVHAQSAATTAALAKAAALEKAAQYQSAYEALETADPKDQDPSVFLRKEALLLHYYLITLNNQLFGLKDLQPGETVAALRGRPGNYSMHPVDIAAKLQQLRRRFPQDYRLAKGQGDYYYHLVECRCGGTALTPEQLQQRVLTAYGEAHAHQLGDDQSYFAVGYVHLLQKQYPESVAAFEQSLARRPDYGEAHFDLASALMQLRRPAEAVPHAQRALALYTDADMKTDALRMLSELYQQQGQAAEARQALQQAVALQPESYPVLRALLAGAVADKSPEAAAWGRRLYLLDPADGQMFNDIMDIFQAHSQWAEAEAFFRERLPDAPATPAAQGLLNFYLGILNMQLERPAQARPYFLTARTQLRKVAKPDNPLFQTIERGLAASK